MTDESLKKIYNDALRLMEQAEYIKAQQLLKTIKSDYIDIPVEVLTLIGENCAHLGLIKDTVTS